MSTPRILTTSNISIFHNLSFEEYLLQNTRSPLLFLYRNKKNIVIGRNQNPWREIHMDRLEADGVDLCRRKSGGGAVYQDLGNTCFSFITPGNSDFHYKAKNNGIILRALKALGVEANVSGRNDLTVNDKKVSGSAYKIVHSGATSLYLHHGTMLLNIDKEGVFKYLNPNKAKLESKGIKSVASRILNLTEVNPEITNEMFIEMMAKSFTKDYPNAKSEELTEYPSEVEEMAEEYLKWEWRYGESPEFTYRLENRFEWGIIDLNVEVEKGVITQIKVFSDCLYPDFIDYIENTLLQQPYGSESMDLLTKNLPNDEWAKFNEELVVWLKEQL